MTAISVETRITAEHRLQLRLPADFPAGLVKVTIEVVRPDRPAAALLRAKLGQRLLAIREQALANGMPTLTQDEVLAEVKRRRGEPLDNA